MYFSQHCIELTVCTLGGAVNASTSSPLPPRRSWQILNLRFWTKDEIQDPLRGFLNLCGCSCGSARSLLKPGLSGHSYISVLCQASAPWQRWFSLLLSVCFTLFCWGCILTSVSQLVALAEAKQICEFGLPNAVKDVIVGKDGLGHSVGH